MSQTTDAGVEDDFLNFSLVWSQDKLENPFGDRIVFGIDIYGNAIGDVGAIHKPSTGGLQVIHHSAGA